MERNLAIDLLLQELHRTQESFPKYHSYHEGLAVIQEEFEELKGEVFKKAPLRDLDKMECEALQVATTSIQFLIDLF